MLEIEIHKKYNDIVSTIKDQCRYDFKNYSRSAFEFRIADVMNASAINSVDEFINHIKYNQSYKSSLIPRLVVDKTEMFRDPVVWKFIRNEILAVGLSNRDSINIWVAGCSSGQEVYTLKILLRELEFEQDCNVWATDIHSATLDKIKSGVYNHKEFESSTDNYKSFGGKRKLTDYYKVEGKNAYLDTSLINDVKFKKHHLAKNSTFEKFDVIICRNVLLYFDKLYHAKALRGILDSLNDGGFLVLGVKDSISSTSLTRQLKEEKTGDNIYRKKN